MAKWLGKGAQELFAKDTCANESAHATDNVNNARPCEVDHAIAVPVHREKVLSPNEGEGRRGGGEGCRGA